MSVRMKTRKTWQKHLPQRPRRTRRLYYTKDTTRLRKLVIKIIWIIVVLFLIQSIVQLM